MLITLNPSDVLMLGTSSVNIHETPSFECSYIYYVQRGGPDGAIKIGHSLDVIKRVQTLSTGSDEPLNLLAMEPEVGVTERQRHQQFQHLRKIGEWFQPAPDLMTHIKRLAQDGFWLLRREDTVQLLNENR